MKTLFHFLTIISFLPISFYSLAQNNNRFDEEIFKLNATAIAKKVLQDVDTSCSLNPNRLKYQQQSLYSREDASKRIVVFEIVGDTAKWCCPALIGDSNPSCYLILLVTNPTKSLSEGFMYEHHEFYTNFDQFIDVNQDGTPEILVGLWDYRGMGILGSYIQNIISLENKKPTSLATFLNITCSVMPYSKIGDTMSENYFNFMVYKGKLYVFLSNQS